MDSNISPSSRGLVPNPPGDQEVNIDAKEAGASYALMLMPSTWKVVMTKDLILRFFCEVWLSFFIIAMPFLLSLVMHLSCTAVRARGLSR
jgi:hypothetical protein